MDIDLKHREQIALHLINNLMAIGSMHIEYSYIFL